MGVDVSGDFAVPHSDYENSRLPERDTGETSAPIPDKSIKCIDCLEDFLWTTGEQTFYRDKGLENPPKRCKPCKKAKTHRLDAIEKAKLQGKKHVIEMKAECARCHQSTTIPFYPSQGMPVYCRACFLEVKAEAPVGANA